MGIFSDILLTVDFDRTLTAPDSSIPERNLAAIRFFMENGGAFTVNTGRSVPMYRPLLSVVPVNAPLLLYNGSAAYDSATGELSLVKPIDLPMEETFREVMRRFPDMVVELQGVDAHYITQPDPDWEGFYIHNHCPFATVPVERLPEPFLKFSLYGKFHSNTVDSLFRGTPEEIAEMDEAEAWLNRRFGGKLAVFRAGTRIIDVHAAGVSKGVAARGLLRQLGRKTLVCVGDALNDLAMLDEADYAFCPADGTVAHRYPNVCPCGEGAVAEVIYKKIPEILDLRLDIR